MKTPADTFTLLLVDDDHQTLAALTRLFRKDGYRLITAASGEEALARFERDSADAALIDYQMPGMDGLELLRRLLAMDPGLQVILLTGQGSIATAVAAMKGGAADFLEKPLRPEALRARVGQLVHIWRLRNENRQLKHRIAQPAAFETLIGEAPAMQAVKQTIARAALSDATVLVFGETGTGKELVARAIHHHSPRSTGPFVPVDCGAISESLVESELFGHVRGAFTGAHRASAGMIRSAQGGTLFLDEVGEMSPGAQAKLLRTLQEKVVRPVGGARALPVDIRIVGATNRDLEREVREGRFREDLFYRLNVVPIHLPPLRERTADLPRLAAHFAARFSTGFTTPKPIDDATLASLMAYAWPGNVRELENALRRALALGREDTITPADLPAAVAGGSKESSHIGAGMPADDSLAAYEKAAIANALHKSRGNRKAAARLLGIGEATLYRKLKTYRLGESCLSN